MSSRADHHAEYHLLYKIINAPVQFYPFPHFYAENVFPEDFYREMTASFPLAEQMRPIGEERPASKNAYPNRYMLALDADKLQSLSAPQRLVWDRLRQFLLSQKFVETLLWKFGEVVKGRLGGRAGVSLRSEALLVDDRENYFLGPHSDNQKKVITALFYLPEDASRPDLGTSIYVPNDPNFKCAGGPEYPAEHFQRVMTMPYRPNTLFMFAKTDNSFHGVEPVLALKSRRRLMLFDVYLDTITPTPAPAMERPKTTFTM